MENSVLRKKRLKVKARIIQRVLIAPFFVCIFLTTTNIKKILLQTYSRDVIEAIYATFFARKVFFKIKGCLLVIGVVFSKMIFG